MQLCEVNRVNVIKVLNTTNFKSMYFFPHKYMKTTFYAFSILYSRKLQALEL